MKFFYFEICQLKNFTVLVKIPRLANPIVDEDNFAVLKKSKFKMSFGLFELVFASQRKEDAQTSNILCLSTARSWSAVLVLQWDEDGKIENPKLTQVREN